MRVRDQVLKSGGGAELEKDWSDEARVAAAEARTGKKNTEADSKEAARRSEISAKEHTRSARFHEKRAEEHEKEGHTEAAQTHRDAAKAHKNAAMAHNAVVNTYEAGKKVYPGTDLGSYSRGDIVGHVPVAARAMEANRLSTVAHQSSARAAEAGALTPRGKG